MRLAFDLHIHSALSPCGSNEMTPNNIVNMAYIKGLNVISVTDHNSVENCIAVEKCAKEKNILFLPGMEVETREEVHLLCYFLNINDAKKFQEIVYDALPNVKNRVDIFGEQLIMDEQDTVIEEVEQLLMVASKLSIDDVFKHVGNMGGAVIPAHVDRSSYSILSNLGVLPEYLEIKTVEISKSCNAHKFIKKSGLESKKYIVSSDAHSLEHISERESFLECDSVSRRNIINSLK